MFADRTSFNQGKIVSVKTYGFRTKKGVFYVQYRTQLAILRLKAEPQWNHLL